MGAYEPCQVRKEAAISRYFYVAFILHRVAKNKDLIPFNCLGRKQMAYTALYRKFRPLKFEDMVGQEHITKTIRNQIIAGRVGHAYLLNGGRGTGKTTSAKILACPPVTKPRLSKNLRVSSLPPTFLIWLIIPVFAIVKGIMIAPFLQFCHRQQSLSPITKFVVINLVSHQ